MNKEYDEYELDICKLSEIEIEDIEETIMALKRYWRKFGIGAKLCFGFDSANQNWFVGYRNEIIKDCMNTSEVYNSIVCLLELEIIKRKEK